MSIESDVRCVLRSRELSNGNCTKVYSIIDIFKVRLHQSYRLVDFIHHMMTSFATSLLSSL